MYEYVLCSKWISVYPDTHTHTHTHTHTYTHTLTYSNIIIILMKDVHFVLPSCTFAMISVCISLVPRPLYFAGVESLGMRLLFVCVYVIFKFPPVEWHNTHCQITFHSKIFHGIIIDKFQVYNKATRIIVNMYYYYQYCCNLYHIGTDYYYTLIMPRCTCAEGIR